MIPVTVCDGDAPFVTVPTRRTRDCFSFFPFYRWPTTKSVVDGRRPMLIVLGGEGKGPLGAYKDLVIDTTPPYVLDIASSKRNGKYIEVIKNRLNLFT